MPEPARRRFCVRALLLLTVLGGFATLPGCDSDGASEPVVGMWRALPGAPVAANRKHDDGFFVSPATGWFATRTGEIYKTEDGGQSWLLQYDGEAYFRSVGFADAQRGWVGNLQGDAGDVLYETRDGGQSWSVVPLPDGPQGLCGISVVDERTVYAVGRLRGPGYLLKTTDGGDAWSIVDMRPYADMLIDVHFRSRDEGFVVGGTSGVLSEARTVILYTRDGGATWEVRYDGPRPAEWAWKISFPSPTVGYVSIQTGIGSNPSAERFLKTTDGGRTWREKVFRDTPYAAQGIGFVTPDVGWMGSWIPENPTLMTEDGGETWREAGFGSAVNRFRFFGDTLGYAMGSTIYKYELGR